MRLSALICLIGFLLSCGQPYDVVEVLDDEGILVERYQRIKKSGAKTGPYQKFGDEGKIVEAGVYKNGALHGARTIYYDENRVKLVETYRKGAFEGPYKYYHENGQVEIEGEYIDGVMAGDWKMYYESGQLLEVVKFVNNEEHGPFTEYHENGKLKTEGHYKNGDNEDGLLKLYNESGELYKKMECDSGKCQTIWTLESSEVGQ